MIARQDLVRRSQDGLAALLGVSAWAGVNLLASLGLVVLAFVMLGGFSMEGLMRHLLNLASRYVAAGAGRRTQFDLFVLTVLAIFFVGTSFFRRGGLVAALRHERNPR